jgi:hypothetical protein
LLSNERSLSRSNSVSKPMALRAKGEKSKVLMFISSVKRHEYELAPDTAGARTGPLEGARRPPI